MLKILIFRLWMWGTGFLLGLVFSLGEKTKNI